MAEPARAGASDFFHSPAIPRAAFSEWAVEWGRRRVGGAAPRAGAVGVASGPSTRPDRGHRAHILPLAAKQRGSKRLRVPKWSGGSSPRAPKPRRPRPSPISIERGARQSRRRGRPRQGVGYDQRAGPGRVPPGRT
eukprot:6199994-Pleurochrysis_carterae.AAC.1